MTPLSPEQWRVLNYLHHHKMHTLRPSLLHLRKLQYVGDADLIDLEDRGLITAILGNDEIQRAGLAALMNTTLVARLRLRLSRPGLHTVLDDPGNQIRFTLGAYRTPIRLSTLFVGNTIVIDDVITMQRRRLIAVELLDFGEFELTPDARRCTEIFIVRLTDKGAEYLPR
ncbi:hypothetical protein [Couchioplanes caeruleus]|uniref:Uncharacterized protein n=2 Tax=Couchioplanes caeruleus TaxID=56438 RepID=A0A1K0FYB0_9ACTN|nr:hypothetical protein [Couchioplanes caeruleus]OJF10058.1 hypothetical protein BG844_34295 [Couchioplanes caeruleus subsp. caeruleus]ROP27656.1 hypothetical protein EDD30_0344 [Couchioplanes caeruleus]